ncbi:uncharacterized protein BJ171DRAFT_190546 [Polychytrium aggregatum]|uniref:uncharacterized protein n=1 Tax=Polychytrium aggregatum TaxID=110093 RepID=UPI0022FE559E|nr:uncharacterized protein BJ171DRAFT_190546 [Polychytrium aggregatum]KAI9202065.1 hypothetical protein BJ171DRAFT_190546 [Polychytrium aggregatum]
MDEEVFDLYGEEEEEYHKIKSESPGHDFSSNLNQTNLQPEASEPASDKDVPKAQTRNESETPKDQGHPIESTQSSAERKRGKPDVSGSSSNKPGVSQGTSGSSNSRSSYQRALYVSELAWWTTDQDMKGVVSEAGLSDDLVSKEILFYEHKANGKSRGIAYLEFKTHQAAAGFKSFVEQRQIHGKKASVKFVDTFKGYPFRLLAKNEQHQANKESSGSGGHNYGHHNQPYQNQAGAGNMMGMGHTGAYGGFSRGSNSGGNSGGYGPMGYNRTGGNNAGGAMMAMMNPALMMGATTMGVGMGGIGMSPAGPGMMMMSGGMGAAGPAINPEMMPMLYGAGGSGAGYGMNSSYGSADRRSNGGGPVRFGQHTDGQHSGGNRYGGPYMRY